MKGLNWKIEAAKKVLEKAFSRFERIGFAWTGGKDSTLVLHLAREMKIKQGKKDFPYPVIFIDHGLHFEETLEFIEKLKKTWKLNLFVFPKEKEEIEKIKSLPLEKQKEKVRFLKIEGIRQAVKNLNLQALVVGIRWDEHEARAREKFFSKREDHVRVHPILPFTEADVWEYIKQFHVPYNPLYDRGYRSIGEKPFTKPVLDPSLPERAGREKEKEEMMEKLRKLGYF